MARAAAAPKPANAVGSTGKRKVSPIAKSGMCKVIDLNCRVDVPVRIHESRSGASYKLTNRIDSTSEVPLADALIFLKDPAFKVYESDGTLLQVTLPGEVSKATLARTECIAKFSELTKEALISRVNRLPGGHVVSMQMTKEQLVETCIAGSLMPAKRVEDTDLDEENGIGEEGTGEPLGELEIAEDGVSADDEAFGADDDSNPETAGLG